MKFLLTKLAEIEVKNVPVPSGPSDLGSVITKITNVLMTVVGIAAVIMLIIGGLMYIFSGGDPQRTKQAKDTILYAIIGLAIAILSYAIVSFVTGVFK